MKSVGIIANPASGKDIRRLVSYATVIDNHEKVNIVKRIILATQALGIEKIYIMPDTFDTGYTAKEALMNEGILEAEVEILDFSIKGSIRDTIKAVSMMEEYEVSTIVVLGGDGTSRAVAKAIKRASIIPISTGTNNVYPNMYEGTVAGMAAAIAAKYAEAREAFCIRDKIIEVAINGKTVDMALIDAVITDDIFVGSKAVWDTERLKLIVVSRCHPASIGFSSVAGAAEICSDRDEFGYVLELGSGGRTVLAAIAAGVVTKVNIKNTVRLSLQEPYIFKAESTGMIALDGERELTVKRGDEASFTIKREGPWRVLVNEAIEYGAKQGIFDVSP